MEITQISEATETKADIYRAKAARCQERAQNNRDKAVREWQLTLARAYEVLAVEAENLLKPPETND
jgi:hypothetical protein